VDALTKIARVDFAGVIRLDAPAGVLGVMPARLDARTGNLIVEGIFARSGLLTYSDGVKTWTEYRSRDELVRAADSFSFVPYCSGHPATMVDSRSWTSVAKGHALGKPEIVDAADGLAYMRGPLMICDAATVAAAQRGEAIELSIGFLSNVVPHADGLASDGTRCDASQLDLEGNHHAGVERGRAGPQCRLMLDGAVVPFSRPFPDLTAGIVQAPTYCPPSEPAIVTDPKTTDQRPNTRHDAAEVTELEIMDPDGEKVKVPSWVAARLAKLEVLEQMQPKPATPPAPAAQPQPMAEAAGAAVPPMPAAPAVKPEDEDEEKKAAAKDAAVRLVRAGRLGMDAAAVATMDAAALELAIEIKSRELIHTRAPQLDELAKTAKGDALAALVDSSALVGSPTVSGVWQPPTPAPIKPQPTAHADAADDPDSRIARAIGMIK
jgi:hypothetical protein